MSHRDWILLGPWRSAEPVLFSLKSKTLVISCHFACYFMTKLVAWSLEEQSLVAESCQFEGGFRDGVHFCSGVRFQRLISDVLNLFQVYFYSHLWCSRLLLAARLFTCVAKKIFKDALFSPFLRVNRNTLTLRMCVVYRSALWMC